MRRVFNRALLRQFYGIQHWDIPAGYLCPPVPGRADYLHGLADLLAADNAGVIPRGAAVRVLDIGTGANCIYPLIGHREYGWRFTGSDIDATALASARTIVAANRLTRPSSCAGRTPRRSSSRHPGGGRERFELTLCNPPFHASQAEAASGSQRKWRNLGKLDPAALPKLNFGGQAAELWCEGGEAAFVARMADESVAFAKQVYRFSTLVSKGGNVAPLMARLQRLRCRFRRWIWPRGRRSRFVT